MDRVAMAGHREPAGSGRGTITDDGCAVEVYLRLPTLGEPELITGVLPPGASVLDLGAGTGRLAHPLIAAGHEVVAVDNSAEMLGHIVGAVTVHADIAGLDLNRTFDAVLASAHLLNQPEAADRAALLHTCRRHVAPDGVVLVQWNPPEWFDTVAAGGRPRTGTLGPFRSALHPQSYLDGVLAATVEYHLDGEVWTQRFTCRRLSVDEVIGELDAAGLRFDRWLTADRTWFAARPATG